MTSKRQFLISVTILATLAFTALSVAKTNGGSSFNVTLTVHDTDANGAQVLMRSDDYNGQGQAVYSGVQDPNITADVYNGVLFLDLYRQTLRTLYLTPNDPYVAAQNPPVPIPPPGYYAQYVELIVHCYDSNLNVVPLQNVTTSSGNCQLGVDFGYGGVKYKFVMGPSLPAPGPTTGLVTVTCNATSGGLCDNWSITPNPQSGNLTNVGNLYYWTRSGKLTYIGGQYYNTFRITMTNP